MQSRALITRGSQRRYGKGGPKEFAILKVDSRTGVVAYTMHGSYGRTKSSYSYPNIAERSL